MEFKKPIVYISIFIIAILVLVSGVLFIQINNHRQNAGIFYKQGLEYYAKEDYQNAYYNFSKILPASDLFYNALYKQAKCADILGDKKTAVRKYSMLDKFVKHEDISPFVLWRLGALYLDLDEHRRAKAVFLRLRKDYPKSEYGIASNYMLSKLTNNQDRKKQYLIDYIKYSPKGKYSNEVLLTLLSEDIKLSDEQKTVLGACLYENGAYSRAVSVLKDAPIKMSWVYLIKALDKLKSPVNILKVAQKGVTVDNSGFDEDSLDEAVSIFLKYHPKGAFLGAEEIYNITSDNRIKGIALYKSIAFLEDKEKTRRKIYLFENFPESKYSPKALFDLFMENLIKNRTVLALKYGKNYIKKYPNTDKTPAVLYFTALLKRKTMDLTYLDTANKLVAEYPHSYYAYRAYINLINKNFAEKRNLLISASNAKIEFPYKEDKILKSFFENFADTKDFAPFDDFRINDRLIRSWIEYKKGNRALSSVLSRDYINDPKTGSNIPEIARKLAYPIYYPEEINKYSKSRNLSPYLILALIKEESHFNPNIRSAVGATGLMQIMPSTASMVSGRAYSINSLTDINLNIDLGTRYFANLMGEFSNNEPLCVLSYNSGPNAVKKWIEKNDKLSFDILVETIPYNETKGYIKKVYTAYWNYLLTYENIKL